MNPLQNLASHGQSIWLDYIRRGMTREGGIAKMVTEDGLRGMTSNPAIFQQAIAASHDYDDFLAQMVGDASRDTKTIFESLAIEDIREAADALKPVYEQTKTLDGYISLEVSPSLADDAEGTLEEARRLWKAVDRPNLMIKVPGTKQGLVAIEELLAEGINVNVTLLFAISAYADVAEAYVKALERRAAKNQPIDKLASVASFFVSRIDVEIDARLDKLAAAAPESNRAKILALRGKAAIANAKLAYADVYQPLVASPRWQALAAKGARPQRLLWASTGTKNKAYPDTIYVDNLIGADTVNTAPPATIDAFRDHGKVANTLTADVEQARGDMAALKSVGVDVDDVTTLLLDRGKELFRDAIDQLFATVAVLQRKAIGPHLDRLELALPGDLTEHVTGKMAEWDKGHATEKLFAKDASLWTGKDEAKWLGWLDIVAIQRARTEELTAFAEQIKASGTKHVVLLGMGGSSLAPDVLARTWGAAQTKEGWPKLRILDSTVPSQVERTVAASKPSETLYIVASKSGSTLEPKVFLDYAYERAKAELGAEAGKRFVAITDPGSKLEAEAKEKGFGRIFHGVPEIGGRYSALSDFGLVPAALIGLPLERFLGETQLMVDACRNSAVAADNPGVSLGIVLGIAAKHGRDKLTIVASPAIASFGAWLEQLVAESTGKNGKAIIPVDGESLAAPEAYERDRIFAYVRLSSTPDAAQDRGVAALAAAGHPVVRLDLADVDALPQEMYRWEIATAVAGAVLELNPFDQPDVEASKIVTKQITAAYEKDGALPAETPVGRDGSIALFTDDTNAKALGKQSDLAGYLRAHLRRIGKGDYFALLAYVDMNEANAKTLRKIRELVRDHTRAATCLGFGPRFLHSTGQAYKGGPNSGVVLQVTCEPAKELAVPGSKLGFGVIAAAQARGDFAVLAERERRALRVHLGSDVAADLERLYQAVREALRGGN